METERLVFSVWGCLMVCVVGAVAASRQDGLDRENSPPMSPSAAFYGELIKPLHVYMHDHTACKSERSITSVFCVFLLPRGLLYSHRHRDVETETRTFYELLLPLNNNTLHTTFVIKM